MTLTALRAFVAANYPTRLRKQADELAGMVRA
jgi:hypothetical protein